MNSELERMCIDNDVSISTGERFLKSLEGHISYVREAGAQLGVPSAQLAIHDDSKFTEFEFPHYARSFGDGKQSEVDTSNVLLFAAAWLHHENHNPHHWGHWVPRSGKFANQPLEMPKKYALESVADWMGASMQYTGSWDMSAWLDRNFHSTPFHPSTRVYIKDVLRELGYGAVVDGRGSE